MKKLFLPIMLVLILALVACGDTSGLVESAQNVAEDVVESVNDELSGTGQEDGAMAECDLDAMELVAGYDATLHLVNKTGETLSFSWLDINQDPAVLSDRGQVENEGTFVQGTTPGHVFVANNADGMPVFEYVVTADQKQCVLIESTEPVELTSVPTEAPAAGPTGETVTVDPTQPIEVTDTNGTQISFSDDPFTDENGNPPAGDVQVNTYTQDAADEGSEAEGSSNCEEPGTSDVLTVWSYNPETGLWEEEGNAPTQDGGCVDSLGTVSVDVSDDAGNQYDLADGATAEVSIPCEPAPDEVLTVWSYDENTGLWVEEGPVVLEGERCSADVSDVSNVNFVATPAEVTETPTEVPEGVSPDWVELQDDTLQDPVFLTGMLLDDSTVTETQGQATLATGHIFAYRNFPYYRDHPLLGITNGMNGWALVVSNSTIEDMIFAPTAKESQTAAGSAALQNLITLTANTTLVIRDIGETNNPVKQGDIVEISYGAAGNMSLPYILTIYRPDTNEILAVFELNSQ